MLGINWKESPFNFIYKRLLYGEKDSDGNTTFQGIPDNPFIDKRFIVVPFTYDPQPFIIESSVTDAVISIKIQNQSPYLQKHPVKELSVYMLNLRQTVLLQLAEGYNYIVIENKKTREVAFTVINAKRYGTLLWSYSQEIYNKVQSILLEQESAIFSKYGTRLVEPLFSRIYQLLPRTKSLQLLSTRLITKTLVSKGGSDLGVKEMGAGLTLNSPYFSDFNKTSRELDPARFPLENYQEFFGGKVAHIWVPNFALVRWKTFLTFIDNIQGTSLEQISEKEVLVKNQSGEIERHYFDQDSVDYFQQLRKLSLDIFGTLSSVLPISFIAPGYPFDLYIDENHLLGDERYCFDEGFEFDSGTPFDSDTLDPSLDYLGMSLIDRNEQGFIYSDQLAYDSTLYPLWGSILSPLVYDKGYYVKCADMEATESTNTLYIVASGTLGDGVKVDEDDGLLSPYPSGTAALDGGILPVGSPDSFDDGTF